jgi:hypothetical protein
VAGVIAIAVAFEQAIAHPEEHLSGGPSLALTLGVALFTGGLAAAALRAGIGSAVVPRAAIAVVALISTPLISRIPASAALWSMAILISAMDLLESRREEPAPQT